ncbi:MAG TPA: hydroxymethylpyrimidine/phosphomethylpyrimidine kinase [Promineifilum sp.]|nr:hydroxymethylpyrimidine/phosphomethylpyrimidine kinase [Promineifilum sp.]HRO90625.1 hydroxymethylpyrimidine/phosphomethylpyrimidine kinase [Promineifilum sp.]HRQ13176.1 hydroxymethylpyrimidine/phosphomethylpyrimidine kinase [Promineifilum sp.]
MTLNSSLPLLTIAGSDSGGAAGLQADLKTWAALSENGVRVYGMSAITAVTAQNSERVAAVHYLPPAFVAAQIDAVLSDYGAAGIKTGFLGRADTIKIVAERLNHWRERLHPRPAIIIDPVLVNHRGEAMFGPEVAAAYREWLFPLADLVTPNAAEAALLGWSLESTFAGGPPADDQRPPTEVPGSDHPASDREQPSVAQWLIKSLRRGDAISDAWWDGQSWTELPQPRIDTINTHGSGDTLSAAVCAYRAMGHTPLDAIRRAQAFTHAAIRRGAPWRLGAGHGPLGHSVVDRRQTTDH